MKKLTIACLMAFTMLVSCKKDKDEPKSSDSRNVRYELTGTARGTYDVTYITGAGSGTNEKPTSLPWTKDIVVTVDNLGVGFSAAVLGATPGTTITGKIYVGGVEKKASPPATVQADGTAIIGGLSYVLK
jgi:hypothetical protein